MIQKDMVQVLPNTGVDTEMNDTERYGTGTGATQYWCRHRDEVIQRDTDTNTGATQYRCRHRGEVIQRDTVQVLVLHNTGVDTEMK